MPCSEPQESHSQEDRRHAAKLAIFAMRKLGVEPPDNVLRASTSFYCEDRTVIPLLCGLLKSLSVEQREALIYDAHCREARDLADWWEAHQIEDRDREMLEAEKRTGVPIAIVLEGHGKCPK